MASRILVTGATGYIGGRLVPELLAAGHAVRCLARAPAKLDGRPWRGDIEVAQGDAADPGALAKAMIGIDAAYYLLHSMGGDRDFAERDRQMAAAFRDAAAEAGLSRIVYLGGLGDERDPGLSPHLWSRHEVGRVLAGGPVAVTELRAAVVIGSGSASFEMLRHLTEVLPVMVTPTWVRTRCQPIAVADALAYLVGVLGEERAAGQVLEIGGPDVLTYQDLMRTYAQVAGLRGRRVAPVPMLSPRLSSLWVGLVTPIPPGLARPLIDSLVNEVTVGDRSIQRVLPRQTLPVRRAIELALQRPRDLAVAATGAGVERGVITPADPLPADPDWSGGVVLSDAQRVRADASPLAVYATVTGVGGDRGWHGADALWRARGVIDQLVGGVGMRRGRRHPDDLQVGDALDFWRVEALVPGQLVRLRAEMRLPGTAWLEWALEPGPGGRGTLLTQRTRFQPRGLGGRCYWYALLPVHKLIFNRLAAHLAEAATGSTRPASAG